MDNQDYDQQPSENLTRIKPKPTDKTRACYIRLILRRIRNIRIKFGLDEYVKVSHDMVIDDFIEQSTKLAPSSIRLYRAAITDWIAGNKYLSRSGEADRLLAKIEDTKGVLPGKQTSTGRIAPKGIPYEDWQRIDRQIELIDPKDTWETIAGRMLRATLHTGMRPAEWLDAKFTGESIEYLLDMGYKWPRLLKWNLKPYHTIPLMFIQNAKHTNGRGGPGFRHVPIPVESIEPIKRVLAHIREYTIFGKHESWLRQVQRGCQAIMERAFPRRKKHYTIYNCRHQFAAELKSANLSKEIIADLMGHTSEETAGQHYARKKSAWKLAPMFREGEPSPPSFVPKEMRESKHMSAPP